MQERLSTPLLLSLVLLSLAVTAFGRSFTAIQADPGDASLFMLIGQRWTEGLTPYVDLWDHKPPGVFALTAAVFAFFPKGLAAVAVVEGLFVLTAIAGVFLLLRRCGASDPTAALAAAACAFASNLHYYNYGGVLTETYLLAPAALAVYCFVRGYDSPSSKWLAASGVFVGLATAFKTVGLAPLAAAGAFLMLLVWKRSCTAPRAVGILLTLCGGFLVAWLPIVAYFGAQGAAAPLLDATLLFNLRYGATSQPPLYKIPLLLGETSSADWIAGRHGRDRANSGPEGAFSAGGADR